MASDFDLKHLIRCICNSQAYQRTSTPMPENKDDDELYSHARLRLISADMLFDSLTVALDHEPAEADAPRKQAKKYKRKPNSRERFLAYFHAEADDDAGVMESYTHGIPQVLRLMNSDELNDTDKVVAHLSKRSKSSEELIQIALCAGLVSLSFAIGNAADVESSLRHFRLLARSRRSDVGVAQLQRVCIQPLVTTNMNRLTATRLGEATC